MIGKHKIAYFALMTLTKCYRKDFIAMCSAILLFAANLSAQQTGQFVENSQMIYIPFTITNYNTKHGLPQNQINDIWAKKNGELILSTANGIVSYDGYSFSNFIRNSAYKRKFHNKLFYSEKYDKLYGLELGGGFNEVDPRCYRIRQFTAACLYNDKIYGTMKDGTISVFDPKDNSVKLFVKTPIVNAVAIYFDGKRFLAGSRDGLFAVDFKSKKTVKLASMEVAQIKQNPFSKDIYFFGKNQAFKLLKNNKVEQLIPEVNTSDFLFFDITFTPNNEIYLATDKGLYYIGYGYSELYDETAFMPSQVIRSLCYSETENCIFAGTSNKGLLKLQLKNCASMTQFTDLSNSSTGSILLTSSGQTLIAGSNGVIYSLSIDNAERYIECPVQAASLAEINGEIWVGTWAKGVYRYKGQKLVGVITKPQVYNGIIHATFRDSRGTIWLGTSRGISSGKSPETIKPVLRKEIKHQIITICQRKNGNLLMGGSDGLYELNAKDQVINHWGEKEGLNCKEVRSIYEDKENKIWLGTYDGGLYCLEKGKLTSINAMKNCMLNEDVFTLAHDFSGNIYMTSNNGLWVISEKCLNDFYRGKLSYLIPFIYGSESGIMNTEFNGGFQNNFAHSKYDHFYFPSIEGIVTVSPEKIVFRKLVPEIKWIRLNNKIANLDDREFARTTSTIEFNFHVANFNSKFNVYYQYKLEGPGTSANWEAMQKSGIVSFSFLPPGKYTIRVRALDGSNDPDPKVVSYTFSIKPYYYETLWFKLLIAFLLISIVSLALRARITARRKKEIRENTINNNIIDLKLKAIQAKMNPHFIFNTLNNIQYLIILNKRQTAEKAINEFSLLLRKFLQQSDQSFIKLKDEISIIEKYLVIEQIRFENNMEVIFDISETCGERIIPTLLLQPVVENAIKHGLAHSDQPQMLILRSSCTDTSLTISIEDNGIGRAASKSINSYRDSHISHGWKLVESKIEMIHLKYDIAVTYEIIDKPEPETGTIVTFTIPLIGKELLNS